MAGVDENRLRQWLSKVKSLLYEKNIYYKTKFLVSQPRGDPQRYFKRC